MYQVTNLAYKLFPCCSSTHPSIQAALNLVQNNNIKITNIERIEIYLPTENYNFVGAPFKIRNNPQVDAQFSNAYTVATAIIKKKISIKDFQESNIKKNIEVIKLAKKIYSYPDKELNWYDLNSVKTKLIIKFKNGEDLMETIKNIKGYPENPVKIEDVINKFYDCIVFSGKKLGKNKADDIVNLILNLEKIKDIRNISNLYK